MNVALARWALSVESRERAVVTPQQLWSAWSWEPSVLLGLALAAALYVRGVRALWRRAGQGRGLALWQVAAFGAGLLALFLALISPLDSLGSALFSAHMVQHLALILVAAPLLLLGAPQVALPWALPSPWLIGLAQWWRRTLLPTLCHPLTRPAVAWALHVVAVWVWHLPGLYQAALQYEATHILEHVSFLGTALLFWWPIVQAGPRGPLGYGVGMSYLFGAAAQSTALGALITLARSPWYPVYAASSPAWGLTPLQDQQLAGLLMWVPAGMVYLLAALILLAQWMGGMEREQARRESGSSL